MLTQVLGCLVMCSALAASPALARPGAETRTVAIELHDATGRAPPEIFVVVLTRDGARAVTERRLGARATSVGAEWLSGARGAPDRVRLAVWMLEDRAEAAPVVVLKVLGEVPLSPEPTLVAHHAGPDGALDVVARTVDR